MVAERPPVGLPAPGTNLRVQGNDIYFRY